MSEVVRRLSRHALQGSATGATREWLVTNGLGGYASGTVDGAVTRRYHALLVAALPAPLGRIVLLTQLRERLRLPDGTVIRLGADSVEPSSATVAIQEAAEFRLEMGLPVWRYELKSAVIEKHVLMPRLQNTVHVIYELCGEPATLELEPLLHFRPHEAPLNLPMHEPYRLTIVDDRFEIAGPEELPKLRLLLRGACGSLVVPGRELCDVEYPAEERRGYEARGNLWSPGHFVLRLESDQAVGLVASAEPWPTVLALDQEAARVAERERRARLIAAAPPAARKGLAAELVLAADQFIVAPAARVEDAARAKAEGDEARTVVAGYHWFTDWGRDTMIALEGLTLSTGRAAEAGCILRTFARHERDGLIPNLFPEGEREGLYHTADASLWFFHAIDRYVRTTGDRETLGQLLPTLRNIIDAHQRGTRFGIRVDPGDGLLTQGAPGYGLTWMDAKVDDWVVTPRRGKAVEINALWYNALSLYGRWLEDAGEPGVEIVLTSAERARRAFNERFWFAAGRYLFDVVDGEDGDDEACRPNQLLAISLAHPVLEPGHWQDVVRAVRDRLLTPMGPRSLAPGHPQYQARYDGNLRTRDAAYHQGTVWAWLIGPFVDAWLKVFPGDVVFARNTLAGLAEHLDEACVGSVSEIFDAEDPYTPRGCIAQAWSVAELLRIWLWTDARDAAGPWVDSRSMETPGTRIAP
jgi:predicted glycogen debranching enzyme